MLQRWSTVVKVLPFFVMLVLVVATLAWLFAPTRRGSGEFRSDPPYAVDRDPFPTIEADTVTSGNVVVVNLKVGSQMREYPVRVRGVTREGDHLVFEHYDPRGCSIGLHGSECVIRSPVPVGSRVRFFPAGL